MIFNHDLKFQQHPGKQAPYQKRFDMFFDDKLNFREHLKYTTTKINKPIRLLRKLQLILPRRTFSVSKRSSSYREFEFSRNRIKTTKITSCCLC